VCNCSNGTTFQHHSSKNKNVPAHITVNEYISLTNHVACMYSHIPFVSTNVQKANVKLHFVFLVVYGHQRLVNMILFTFSPTTATYVKPQCTCKSSTLDELLCPVHCLNGLFEKATALSQTENNTQR